MVATQDHLHKPAGPVSFHPFLKGAAKAVSYIFHPLFVPVYVCWFLVYEARLFPNRDAWHKTLVMIQFFVSYTLLPLVTILLAKALGFVQSVFLNTQKDRILPYIVCEIFYFWAWYVSKNLGYPKEFILFSLGVFLATSLGLIFNNYLKVSMHAISMGVLATFMVLSGFMTEASYGIYISIAFLIAGIVCTARMLTSNHIPAEIYIGFFIGVLTQVIAAFFV